jgi:hypothetical protein
MDSTLLEAYRRTAFIAETPEGRLSLRVGQGCAELDTLLAAHDVGTWAYVTAFNPGSVRLTLQENSERQRQLEHTVADLGFSSYPGEGIGDDGQWAPEPSLLVLGIDRNDARLLGRQYGQLAVIYGELNRDAELLVCDETPGR